jgi:hypothetical protein
MIPEGKVEIFERAQVRAVGTGHQRQHVGGIFPIYKKEDRSFAGLSAGRRREKFTPVEAENRAFQ